MPKALYMKYVWSKSLCNTVITSKLYRGIMIQPEYRPPLLKKCRSTPKMLQYFYHTNIKTAASIVKTKDPLKITCLYFKIYANL